MKRLLLVVLLSLPAVAQLPGYAVSSSGTGLQVCIGPGSNTLSGSLVSYAGSCLSMTKNLTNYGYLDGTTGALTVNTSGVPTNGCPIFEADTDFSQVTKVRDKRPSMCGSGTPSGGALPTNCSSPSSGIINCNIAFQAGTSLPTACGAAGSCIAFQGASTPGSPTAGQAYIRYDSASQALKAVTENGSENIIPEATGNGKTGQPLLSNGDGTFTPADPFISVSPITLFNAQATTGTATSAAQSLSLLSTPGTISYTFAGLTGTYTSCTLQMLTDDGFGNQQTNGSAITLTMTNAVHSFDFNAGLVTFLNSPKIAATFACSAYGSAGTMTITFTPSLNVNPTNTTSRPLPIQTMGRNGTAPTNYLNYPICDQVKAGQVSASGSTQVIAAPGGTGQSVHVCSLIFAQTINTTVTAKLVTGIKTTNDCDTNTADLSVALVLVSTSTSNILAPSLISPHNSDWHAPIQQQVCVNLSAAVAVNYQINYAVY